MALTLYDVHTLTNFIINKEQGGWYAPEQIDSALDFSQMSLYNDYYLSFGTSQRLNDALAPFKRKFQFSNITSPTGLVTMPDDYYHLMNIYTVVQLSSGRVLNRPVPILNEDEKVARDNSQIYPPTTTDPYGIIVQNWNVQLYPQVAQAGYVDYLKRPVSPSFSYEINGRQVVYLPNSSVQLEWSDKDLYSIVTKAINLLGINLSEQDVLQWSQQKDQENILSKLKT